MPRNGKQILRVLPAAVVRLLLRAFRLVCPPSQVLPPGCGDPHLLFNGDDGLPLPSETRDRVSQVNRFTVKFLDSCLSAPSSVL